MGSTVLTTGVSGSKKYHAYGGGRGGSVPTEWQYTGQELDSGTGLVYLHARYYDPATGQFLSPDTIVPEPGNVLAYNRYMYGYGSPLRFSDPSGHEPLTPPTDDTRAHECSYVPCALIDGQWVPAPPGTPYSVYSANYRDPEDLPTRAEVQTSLSACGIVIPICDAANGAIYAWNGEWTDAGIATVSIVPFGDILKVTKVGELIGWTSKSVKTAAKLLEGGETAVHVASRAEAEELFLGLYQGKGYVNTTGMSAVEAAEFYGKGGTYHWDDVLAADGSLAGHGPNNPHGVYQHLQIEPPRGHIIRVNFGEPLQ